MAEIIKLGFYTDIHHSGNSPSRRKDNYPEAVRRKHRYIYKDGEERGVDLWLNGGDVNESPLVERSIINEQFDIMSKRKAPEYAIYGNHDVIGNNVEKAHQVSTSLLYNAGFLKLLNEKEPVRFGQNGITLAIYGVNIHKDMDNLRPEDYYVKKPEWADWCILVAHGWLTEHDKKLEGLHHTTFQAVLDTGTEADVIYTGHYHPGHGTVIKEKANGKELVFHNPGSPVRMKALMSELTRKVGYSITVFTKHAMAIEFIEFPEDIARPGEEILDRESLEREIAKAKEREQIQFKFADTQIRGKSPKEVILRISEEKKLSKKGREDLIGRVENAIMVTEAARQKTAL